MTNFAEIAIAVATARAAGVCVLAETDGRVAMYGNDNDGIIPVEYLGDMAAHAATDASRAAFRAVIAERASDFARAVPIATGWAVYHEACPCEAYAVHDCHMVTGDMSDISAFVAAGVAFLTYEGHATKGKAQRIANELGGEGYSVKPLPAGAYFYDAKGIMRVVAAETPRAAFKRWHSACRAHVRNAKQARNFEAFRADFRGVVFFRANYGFLDNGLSRAVGTFCPLYRTVEWSRDWLSLVAARATDNMGKGWYRLVLQSMRALRLERLL